MLHKYPNDKMHFFLPVSKVFLLWDVSVLGMLRLGHCVALNNVKARDICVEGTFCLDSARVLPSYVMLLCISTTAPTDFAFNNGLFLLLSKCENSKRSRFQQLDLHSLALYDPGALVIMASRKRSPEAAPASASQSGAKQAKLFQPVAVKFEPTELIHSVNLQRISAVTQARDEILQHPVFADMLSASPLKMEEGNHKAQGDNVFNP